MQGLAREGSRVQRCPRWPLELAVSWRQSRVVCLLSAFLLPESRVSLAPQWPPDTTPPRGSGLVPASGSLRPQPCPHAGGSSFWASMSVPPESHWGPSEALLLWPQQTAHTSEEGSPWEGRCRQQPPPNSHRFMGSETRITLIFFK